MRSQARPFLTSGYPKCLGVQGVGSKDSNIRALVSGV